LCLITIDQVKSYFWHNFMYKFKDQVRVSQEENPDFCRAEGINVMDLSGLSASSLTTETLEVIKILSKVSDFFPETLHCMLVLNAPSFFTFSWKLIKNFIDPRTASRVQLFSNNEKGHRALEKLIDKDTQIPVDYGGGNISLQGALLKECSDEKIIREEIELLHCKRWSKRSIPNTWTLQAEECIEITVYTRSVGKASIAVILNGSTIKTAHAQCKFVEDEERDGGAAIPHPSKTVIMTSLAGPGEVMVEAKDMDSQISKAHSHCSKGYFLVVGDVKKMSKNKAGFASNAHDVPGISRRVSFSFEQDDYNHNQYKTNRNQMEAKVTMTGLTLTPPRKVDTKRDPRKLPMMDPPTW